MIITHIIAQEPGTLLIIAEDGRSGSFDITPYLNSHAFAPLKDWAEFREVRNCGYFIEWPCGADLSADTIEARWTRQDAINFPTSP